MSQPTAPSDISQVPRHPVPVPEPLRPVLARYGVAAGTTRLPAAWVNAAGGTTFHLEDAGVFCKWAPAGAPLDLTAEADRSRWAAGWLPVPQVLESGSSPQGSWLLSRALPGTSAVAARWKADPAVAVRALGRALRRFHDALPVAHCPFDWQVPYRLGRAVGDTSALLDPPPVDRLVVCHGDACTPNTLLIPTAEGAEAVAWVDLSGLGVADRWADIAVATMALGWNYDSHESHDSHDGRAWEELFLDAYGVSPDPVRTAYYRALWDVGP